MQCRPLLRRISGFSLVSLALLVVLVGCDLPAGEDSSTAPPEDAPPTSDAVEPQSDGDANEPVADGISVRTAGRKEYDETIASHQGKVVLVDFWATWCGPCVEQFPHTVELGEKYADAGLAVVTVSVDEADNKENVLAFLKEKHAAFDNLLSEQGIDEVVVKAFEISDGAVPHYKLYDRSGKLRFLFGGMIDEDVGETPDKIEIRIKELLAEKPEGESLTGSE